MGGLYYNLASRSSGVANKNPEKPYYCALENRGVVDQETLVSYLSQVSGIQDALYLAVFLKLGATITNFLKDGQSAEILHLGSFSLTANSSGVKIPNKAKASQIKSINLRFSSKEETDLVLNHYTLTRGVLMANTNGVIKEKDPSGEIVDGSTT